MLEAQGLDMGLEHRIFHPLSDCLVPARDSPEGDVAAFKTMYEVRTKECRAGNHLRQ